MLQAVHHCAPANRHVRGDRASRCWATLYRASPDSEKGAVIDALCKLTGWSVEHVGHVVTGPRSTPLLQFADDRVRGLDRPRDETVFVHGDL